LIVPIVAWVKKQFLADVPINAYILQAVLAIALGFLLKVILAPEATPNELLMFILANLGVSSGVHAGFKTYRGRTR